MFNHYWNQADVDCFHNHMIRPGILSYLKGKTKEIASIYGCIDWPSIKDTLSRNFTEQKNKNLLNRDLLILSLNPKRKIAALLLESREAFISN